MHSKQIANLFKNARKLSCAKGQVLISPASEPRGVHYIHSGYVKTYDISTEGEYQVIAISGPGEIFPLYWSIDEEHRQLFYEAMCPIVFSRMPKTEFKSAFETDIKLMKDVLRFVLQSFHFSQERIQNLEFKSARQRVAFRLLFLGEHFGHKQGTSVEVDVPITYQDLAESLNLTRETVNRIMRHFISDGTAIRKDHHVTIRKPDELRDILGETSLEI